MPKLITLKNLSRFKTKLDEIYGTSKIPTKTSELTNDSGFITINDVPDFRETDPTVPDWAKRSTKPEYDYSEINNTPEIPSTVGLTSKTYVDEKDAELNAAIEQKVDKVDGKGLSSNDYTDEDKSKLESLSNYDDTELRNEIPTKTSELTNDSGFITAEDVPEGSILYQTTGQNTDGAMTQKAVSDELNNKADKTEIPSSLSQLNNDAGFITVNDIPPASNIPTKTSELENDSGFITVDDIPDRTETDPTVPAWAKQPTKPEYEYGEIKNTPNIPSVEGLASESYVDGKATELNAAIENKVEKVDGKELSTNDYTNEDKSKLESLSNYDDTTIKGLITAEETARKNADTTLQSNIDAKYTKPSTGISKTDLASDVQTSLDKADAALNSAKSYADEKVGALRTELYGTNSNEVIDTITEIANALKENDEVVDALDKAISSKASQSELNSVASSLADLSETVDVLDGNIGDVHTIVSEHTQDISSLKTKNTQQDTSITNLSNDLSTTNNNVTNLINKVTNIEKIDELQDEAILSFGQQLSDKADKTQLNNYATKQEGVYLVDGTGNTTAGTWTGTNNRIASYYDGLTVNFKIGVAGGTSTTGTTLNINGLGAKMCFMRGSTKITTHYAVGTTVLLTYSSSADDGNGGFYSSDYDANNNVTQTARDTNGNFPLLLRGTSAGTTTTTTTTTFGTKFTANPSTGELKATKFTENGTTLASKYLGINSKASSATTADTATTATKATQDGDGNVISTTYAKKTDLPTILDAEGYNTNAVMTQNATTLALNAIDDEILRHETLIDGLDTKVDNMQTTVNQVQGDYTYMNTEVNTLKEEVRIRPDWNETNTASLAYIKNKPTRESLAYTLYNEKGQNTDGPMTQKATTDAIASETSARTSAVSTLQKRMSTAETDIDNLELDYQYKAEVDASNLTSANVTSWKSKLGLSGVESATLLYDKSSSDANINWGYTDGIVGGTTLNKPEFMNYKRIRFYILFVGNQTEIDELDMLMPVPKSTAHRRTGSAALSLDEPNSVYTSNIVYNTSSYAFWFELGFLKGTSYNARNNNSEYFIYKIEGIN